MLTKMQKNYNDNTKNKGPSKAKVCEFIENQSTKDLTKEKHNNGCIKRFSKIRMKLKKK